ncbi:MAG: D-alanine--D-alanine ligase [Deltaproteobacteria bacterium]|nr:D-alanine--D-alanine ligase [Deltaproteobacteria bacterium]
MRIAFTHNLQKKGGEEEAEFDSPETVVAITRALESLGHDVVPVDVDMSVTRLISLLEGARPDLILNTAEGWRGAFREALFPALFETLGLPFVGPDAHACALALDKHATKALVAELGVPMAPSVFVQRHVPADLSKLELPVIVKPNFEGSSKGIEDSSVVTDRADLEPRVAEALARYPDGVLVEELIPGVDIVVPFIAGLGPDGGALTPATYRFSEEARATSRHGLYGYELKNHSAAAVDVVPAALDAAQARDARAWTRAIAAQLGLHDMARIDFRLTPEGQLLFIEAEPLPSLELGASPHVSAALAGATTTAAVLEAILKASCARQGLAYKGSGKAARSRSYKVGLVYNLKRVKPKKDGENDAEAEFDAPETIDAIAGAIEGLGHTVVRLEADRTLLNRIGHAGVDVVFNIAEGVRGRGREALVPAILELLDIPYTGSDPATLALTLDKALAKRLVREAGVRTPDFVVMTAVKQKLPPNMTFPLVVKPVAEGSSKGVLKTSVVRDDAELRALVTEILARYDQGALVEEFLPGREFTVGILGGTGQKPRVLPPMEIVFNASAGENPVYTFEHKQDFTPQVTYQVPAHTTRELADDLARAARLAWDALGCRDVSRMDLRLDHEGRVSFIECNPLPGLTPDWSDLCLIAKGAGLGYQELIAEILAPAVRRLERRLGRKGR